MTNVENEIGPLRATTGLTTALETVQSQPELPTQPPGTATHGEFK